jgi:hypothetical protein
MFERFAGLCVSVSLWPPPSYSPTGHWHDYMPMPHV